MLAQPTLLDGARSQRDDSLRTLPREQLVGGILEMNPTATTDFLMSFSDRSLKRYLDHLALSHGPRGPKTAWVREADAPGIVERENLD